MQLSLLGATETQADRSFARSRRIALSEGAWLDWVPGWISGHERLFDRLMRAARWERHGRQMYERYVEVPRLVAGCPGTEGGLQLPGEEVLETASAAAGEAEVTVLRGELEALAQLLSERYGRSLDRISLAYYRDGHDSVAFHGDKLGRLRADTVVAIASLGAPRRFLLRPVRGARAHGVHGRVTTGTDPEHIAGETSAEPIAGETSEQGTAAAPDAVPQKTRRFHCGEGDLLVMGGDCQDTWEHGVPKAAYAGPRIALMFRETHTEDHAENPEADPEVDAEADQPGSDHRAPTEARRTAGVSEQTPLRRGA